MSKRKNDRNKQIRSRNSGSGSAEPDSVTAYFLNLKRDWSTEQFKKQENFFRKNYTGTTYTGSGSEPQPDAKQPRRGSDQGTRSRERWKNNRKSWRNDERERREREQLQDDYFSSEYDD